MTFMNPEIFKFVLDAEEASGGLFSADQVGGYAVTVLVTILNVIVLYIIVKLAFKPIMGFINKRKALIDASVDDAKKVQEDAKNSAEEGKKVVDDARLQAAEIIEASKENADKQGEVIISKANEDAAEIISRAENEAKRIKKVALEEMKDEISDLAVVIAGKVLGDVVSEDKLKSLSNKYTNEVLEEEVNKLG